jgi:hypothetical protein
MMGSVPVPWNLYRIPVFTFPRSVMLLSPIFLTEKKMIYTIAEIIGTSLQVIGIHNLSAEQRNGRPEILLASGSVPFKKV